jgi:hypothetical protein
MYSSFLEDYKITSKLIEEQGAKSIGNLRHLFFTLPEFQIQEALNTFDPFPEELKMFYHEIGFGFMHRAKLGKFNILFDPMTLIYTNKQVNYFATPEIEEELKYYDIEKHLLFFKTISNQYLAIDRQTINGKNVIYYRGTAIEDSLYDFLKHFDFNRYYLNQLIDTVDYKQKPELKESNWEEEKKALEKKYNVKDNEMLIVEGHYRIID